MAVGAVVVVTLYYGMECAQKMSMTRSGPANGIVVDIGPPAWPIGAIFPVGTDGYAAFGDVEGIYLGEVHAPIRDYGARERIVRQALAFGARSVHNLDLGDAEVFAILREHGRLVEYVFATCDYRGDESVRAIFQLADSLPSLRGVSLQGNAVTDEAVQALCKSSCELETIALGGGEVSDRTLALIAERWPRLTSVKVGTVSLSPTGLDEMCRLRELRSLEIIVGVDATVSKVSLAKPLALTPCENVLVMSISGETLYRRSLQDLQ